MRSVVTIVRSAAFTISLSIQISLGFTRALPAASASWTCTTATSTASGVQAT